MTVDWEIHETTLRRLAESKNPLWSAQDIADVVGGDCTRNAVIGKARRLGISISKKPVYRKKKPVKRSFEEQYDKNLEHKKNRTDNPHNPRRNNSGRLEPERPTLRQNPSKYTIKSMSSPKGRTPPEPLPEPTSILDGGTLDVGLLELHKNVCKWPTNSPLRGESYTFCGHTTGDGDVYCATHMRIS